MNTVKLKDVAATLRNLNMTVIVAGNYSGAKAGGV
jgi:hypothetical protein